MLRSRALTFAALGLGGLLGLVATAQPWWRAVAGAGVTSFPGTEATGGLSRALTLVALAGTLLVLVLQARGRRVVALLLATLGFAMAVLGAVRQPPAAAAVRAKLRRVSLDEQYALDSTAWPYGFAVAGLLVLLGAVLLCRAAALDPAPRDRYTRAVGSLGTASADDPAVVWRAQDAGLDPTDEDGHGNDDLNDPSRGGPDPAAAQPGRDPVVRIGAAGATMGASSGQHPLPSDPPPLPHGVSSAGQSPRTVGPSPEPE